MRLSYCTVCYNRLWQLKQTIKHNIEYTRPGEIDLCVLAYNDPTVKPYLVENYSRFIDSGQLKIFEVNEDKTFEDGTNFSCGYTKDLIHSLATGSVLFNLDSDNYTDHELSVALLNLDNDTIIITKQSEWSNDGRSGRIGVPRVMYGKARYRDKGRCDDGDFIGQCLKLGARVKQVKCKTTPVPNEPINDI